MPSIDPIFAETVPASAVRAPTGNRLLADVTGDKALRIVHRGHAIKVVITEERYLQLLAFWKMFEQSQPIPGGSIEEELAAGEKDDEALDHAEAHDIG